MIIRLIPDANTGGGSSPAPDTSAQTELTADAKPSASSTETPAEVKKTFREIAHEVAAKHTTSASTTTNGDKTPAEAEAEALAEKSGPKSGQDLPGKAEAKVGENTPARAEQTPKPGEQPADKTTDKDKDKDKGDDTRLPFHNHPRFKQLIEERNNFERQVRELTPLTEAGRRMQVVENFCKTNGVNASSYDNAIRLAALVGTNPEKAVEALDKLTSELKVRIGQALPPDLQTQVDEGKIALTHAQEISRLRVQAQRSTHEVNQTKEQTQAQIRQQLTSSLDAWTQSRMQTDPSYKPSTDGSYGKFEQIQDRFMQLVQRENPTSIDSFVKLADKAYSEVHQFLERSIPKPPQRRPVPTSKSVREEEKPVDIRKPGWAREVARRTLAAV